MRRAAAIVFLLACSAAATAQPASPEPPATVAIDLATLSGPAAERIDALGLESRIILRLLQEGFQVAAPFSSPDIEVRAEAVDEGVRLIASGGGGEQTATVVFGNATRAELQLEIAQKVVDLVRSRAAAVRASRELGLPPPPPPELPPAPPPEPPAPPPRPVFDLAVGGGVLWRGPALDPQLFALLGLQGRGLFGVGASLALDRSSAAEGSLQIVEWQATVGPRMRLLRAGSWGADIGVEVGVAFHAAWLDGVYVQDANRNPRLDVLAQVPVTLFFEPTDRLRLGLRLAPGISGRSREHVVEGNVIWHSELARLEAGAWAGLAF